MQGRYFYLLTEELSEFIKVLRCAEFKSQEVISLAFSHDSKYLLAQGGPPDYRFILIDGDDLPVRDPESLYCCSLVYFFWEKNKVITTIKALTTAR